MVIAYPALCPTAVFLSPVVIAVPASLPMRVLAVASVPLKLSPAPSPTLVLFWSSLASIPPSAFNIPLTVTPSEVVSSLGELSKDNFTAPFSMTDIPASDWLGRI